MACSSGSCVLPERSSWSELCSQVLGHGRQPVMDARNGREFLALGLHLSRLLFTSSTAVFDLSTAFTSAQMLLTSDFVMLRLLCWGHLRCSLAT